MKKSILIFKSILVTLAVTLFVSCKKELDLPQKAPQINQKESLQRNPSQFIFFPDTTRGKPVKPGI